ncbi:MAG: ABC transporter substrate-binding protein [Deltaproteobacteria bacterium]|jgi:taurine transport system substrate-binding protein|nr:ABC transporter substrate-binding protein [Deltaproteobacteria bacterium]
MTRVSSALSAFGLFWALALPLLFALPGTSFADDPKVIRIGYFQSPNGELLAKGQGQLKKRFPDTEIQYVKFDVGRDVIAAISGGSLDIGIIGTPPGTAGLVNGIPYKIFFLHDIVGESEALVVKNSSGIDSIKDVVGKTIASPFGSTSHFSLLSALKQNGIDPKDVKIIDITGQEVIAAWSRGDIDGAYIWQPSQATLLADGGKVVISSREVAAKGGITGEFGIVHDDFYKAHPEVVKAYVDILDQAAKEYNAASPETVAIMAKELGLSEDETRKVMAQLIVLDKADQKDPRYIGTTAHPGALADLLKDNADFLLADRSLKSSPPKEFFQPYILTELYDD